MQTYASAAQTLPSSHALAERLGDNTIFGAVASSAKCHPLVSELKVGAFIDKELSKMNEAVCMPTAAARSACSTRTSTSPATIEATLSER